MQNAAPPSFSGEIKRYTQLFRHWSWLVVTFAVLGGALAYVVSIRQPKIYQATATILVDQPQGASDFTSAMSNDRLAQTYSQMMVQQSTLEGVIQRLGLTLNVDELGQSLTVQIIPETQLLRINVEDTDPEQAAKIVNTIGIVFEERTEELQASRYRETKESLQAQILSTEDQIHDTTQALETLSIVSETDSQVEILQVQLDTYRNIYQGLLTQIIEAETQSTLNRTEDLSEDAITIEDQLVLIEEKILEISAQIEELGYFPKGAEYEILVTELSAYQDLYRSITRDLVLSAGNQGADPNDNIVNPNQDVKILSTQLEVTATRIQDLTTEINSLGNSADDGVERDRLESNLVLYRQTYANLVQSYEQVRLAEIQNTSRVDLVQPAAPPSRPIRPVTTQNTMLGSILGLFIGACIIFLMEALDDTVKGPADIFQHLGLPVLGYISHFDERGIYPVTSKHPRSPLAEAFRSLRTNIQYASIDHPLFSLMVTSPTPRDGKSIVSANLGVVLAQGNNNVIIIDADMRRPDQHNIFDLPNRNGLTDTLIQPANQAIANIQKTDVDNLSILTTGDLPPNPAELVGSDKMLDLIGSMANHTDLVIIDTPPVMAVTDPVILSTRVDGVVIIIRPGVTKLAAAIHTSNQLKQVGANILGVVLNNIEKKSSRYNYSYNGYYYSYDKYYGYDPVDESNGDSKGKTKPRINKTFTPDR